MAMRPILYYALFSPPARACLLTSKIIGLDLQLKPVDYAKREHFSDWFLKINPRHTVPVLQDKGVTISESHAIITYLVGQYGGIEHDHLYPRNLLKRAVVDERLYYESSMLFQIIKEFANKILHGSEIAYSRKDIQLCHNSYAFLEEFLKQGPYVAGDKMTVADISINTTLITLHMMEPVQENSYPRTHTWMQRMRAELPEYKEINEQGAYLLYKRFEDTKELNMTKTG